MHHEIAAFVVDPTLGRLAKWLRIMGCDAHYQTSYQNMDNFEQLLKNGRVLLTRKKALEDSFSPSIFIKSATIEKQLKQLKESGLLPVTSKNWFKRCIKCNIPLQTTPVSNARGRIPEYIASQNIDGIRYCPSCKRYFWPGSHRKRMLQKIKEWELMDEEAVLPIQPNETNSPDTDT